LKGCGAPATHQLEKLNRFGFGIVCSPKKLYAFIQFLGGLLHEFVVVTLVHNIHIVATKPLSVNQQAKSFS
jgi:hypothetical protein